MLIGKRDFDTDDGFYIMGILNLTPDSFSDGGSYGEMDKALFRVEEMISEGADIIDIGGESTRPGYTQISCEEEIARTAPVIEAVCSRFDIPVSLDTYKYKVAHSGIQAGAHMINDIWGLKYDGGEMARLIAKSGLPCCLMHNRRDKDYNDLITDIANDLNESISLARTAGIDEMKIILDPGIGFAKSYENNLEVIDKLDRLCESFVQPFLLGASRKSVIGKTLDLLSEERIQGTLAVTVTGALKGARFFRVHDVKENYRALKMVRAITKGYK